MFLSVLLLLISGTEAAYYGSVQTSTTKDLVNDGFLVTYRRMFSFSSCEEVDSFGYCESSCIKIEESRGEWCQKQYTWSRTSGYIYSSSYAKTSPQWTTNRNGITTWRAWYRYDERSRSDISKSNSSPQTTIIPVLRVPSNCQRDINLLTFDPDGDEVKCRYASSSDECNTCTSPSVLSLYSSCIVSFSPTSSSAEGSYAVQLQMDDFPREDIIMTYNGEQSPKSTTSYLSSSPVQFVFTVDPAAPSCTEGEYLPKFMPPTPEHGAQFFIDVHQTLEITIKAEATQALTTELLFSGPVGVVKNSSGSGYFTMRWTPSEDHDKESHPICFVFQANISSSTYQSEFRCLVVTVGDRPTVTPTTVTPTTTRTTTVTPTTTRTTTVTSTTVLPTIVLPTTVMPTAGNGGTVTSTAVPSTVPLTTLNPPPKTSHLTVVRLKISTKLSLKDDQDKIVKALKVELIKQGLPPDIKIRLLSNGSLEVSKTADP